DAGRQRIARVKRHIGNAAALCTVFRAPRPFRKNFAFDISVFVRIGINQAADGTVLGGDFGLDAAPRVIIARDDDRALHRDAHAIELLVIFGHAVVDVDEWRGDVTVFGVDVVCRQLLAGLIRSRVLFDYRLLQLGDEFRAAFD